MLKIVFSILIVTGLAQLVQGNIQMVALGSSIIIHTSPALERLEIQMVIKHHLSLMF